MHGADLEDRLVERLRRLPDALAEPAREDRLRQAIRRGRARLVIRRAAAMTALLGVLAGAVLVRAEVLDRTPMQVAGPGPTAAELARGSWRAMAPAPIVDRRGAAAAWTGRELLVWGGATGGDAIPSTPRFRSDGAAYDPATDAWRRLPPSPIGSPDARLSLDIWTGVTAGVWTGRELLLVGVTGPYGLGTAGARLTGAAYDPARDAWRVIGASPVVGAKGARVMRSIDGWTGSELLIVADSGTTTVTAAASTAPSQGQPRSSVERRTLLAYDPVVDRWTTTSIATAPFATGSYVWTGSEMLAVGPAPSPRAASPRAAAPAPAPGPGRRLDPTDGEVRPMAAGPLDAVPAPILLWTGRALLGVPVAAGAPIGDLAVWDPAGDRWHSGPRPPHRLMGDRLTAVWTGRQLLLWGGDGARPTPGLVYTVG